MFPKMYKSREIYNFTQANGAFHLVTCSYNSLENTSDDTSEHDKKSRGKTNSLWDFSIRFWSIEWCNDEAFL